MTIELYEGRFSPLTSEIGFLECDADIVVEAYSNWMKDIQTPRGVDVVTKEISEMSLGDSLLHLLPLTSIERRRTLLVPTSGKWTAYFDNGWRGADAASVISYLSRTIKCRGVRSCYIPDMPNRLGAVIMEMYSPANTHFINTLRSVCVINEGERWKFYSDGEVQSFEDTEKYKNRIVKNRFTGDMLKDYLSAIGIMAFDDVFYNASSSFIIENIGVIAKNAREYSLDNVQNSWK